MVIKKVKSTVTLTLEFSYNPESNYVSGSSWAPSRIVQTIQELVRGEASEVSLDKYEVVSLTYDQRDVE